MRKRGMLYILYKINKKKTKISVIFTLRRYPLLHNPSPNYGPSLHCTHEVGPGFDSQGSVNFFPVANFSSESLPKF